MPVEKYFKGKGEKVLADMIKRYGPKKGKSVFYATANKENMTAEDYKPKKSSKFHNATYKM